ncbi:MAG: hypothetical protein J5808_02950, partial [Paludibacteraceae bacterium]|nr:hypothetical protein [Paludibacteraceae bacterium]
MNGSDFHNRMQRCLFLLASLLCLSPVFAQTTVDPLWSADEIARANTAQKVSYLTQEEKNVVLYINLARLYPHKFLKVEVLPYQKPDGFAELDKSSYYYRSLVSELKSAKPAEALLYDSFMHRQAVCWADEMGRKGVIGHDRTECAKHFRRESCQYGFHTGRDIVMALLIDDNVPNLGHRHHMLDESVVTVGVAIRRHTSWNYGTVIDSDDPSMRDYKRQLDASVPAMSETLVRYTPKPLASSAATSEILPSADSRSAQQLQPKSTGQSQTQTNPQTQTQRQPQSSFSQNSPSSRGSVMTRFYNYSGSTVLSALQLGYAYDFSDNRHLISAGTLAFRYHLFELNLLQFELGVSPFDSMIGWNPSVGASIPFSKSWAVGVYGAVSLDFSPVVAWLDDDYG